MYANENFKSKKALKEAVAIAPVPCHQPGPFGPHVADGRHAAEGPHHSPSYLAGHRWYAQVEVKDGFIIKVVK